MFALKRLAGEFNLFRFCLLLLQGKDRNIVNEGDSGRAAENIDTTPKEKVESTALVLSAAPDELARSDTVLDHPLNEQMIEDNGREASVRVACEICIEI